MAKGKLLRSVSLYASAAFLFALPTAAFAQVAGLDELSEAEQRQVQIAERFLTILERNPRRGTALDRIYGHHVEFGTLDAFMDSLRERVEKNAQDGTGWMLLGLFESHRGNDGEAVTAFEHAEKLRLDDALASYYLGQSLLLIGQPEKAVAAFEKAIDRKPPRADMLQIFQQLGRVHQRAQRQEEALRIWERLEALFPDDPRVQEQIAVTLVEEGAFELALPRYEKLAELVRDDYRRTTFRIEAAELKVRLGEKEAGLSDLETLLDDLNPEGWLHRDVRRRIEDVFLQSGDQDGLVKYYESWIDKHADDVEAMARLSKFLADAARLPEAKSWLEKALELAPSRVSLRKAFIDQLIENQEYAEAAAQYKLLVESAPGNVDFLRDWGRVVLKNKEIPKEEREQEATQIWRQILASRPDDALTHAQVADLFRQSNLNEEALALYQQAVTLASNDPQYREYLGEYYHILKRPDEALATWKTIAEGERRNATNVARLAEVYNSFGYFEQAVEQIALATELDPKDFNLQLKSAEYHNRAGKYDAALQFVAAAGALAANDEEREAVVTQRIDVFQSSRRLNDEIGKLVQEIKDAENPSLQQWHLLARYYEAGREWANSLEALDQALEQDAKSIPVLTTAARVSELSGDYARAARMNRDLAESDRRARGDHLMNVARLEAQLGRTEEALQAGQELIVSAPGNTDHYEFYAQLCFRLGEIEQGLDTLRKAVRINPNEPALISALGGALSDQFRTDEAIEVYWRAFEKCEEIDDQTSLIMKLTELHLQINQFDKLIDRLEREQREEDKRREMTICLAQAHHTSGDYGTARAELESLLSQNTRDTNLLQQISKLCEEGSDLQSAIEYQRQLVDIAPGQETEYRLATLLQRNGDQDEASEIFLKLIKREEDPVRLLRSLDSLLRQQSFESVIAVTEPLLSEQRDNWELLYREATAWASLDRTAEAQAGFARILAIKESHEELGVAAQEKLKRDQAKARSNNLQGIQSNVPQRQSPLSILSRSYEIRRAVGLDDNGMYNSPSQATFWAPDSFGQARMAAYAWLMKLDQESFAVKDEQQPSQLSQRFEKLEATATADDAPPAALYDWLYVEQLRGNMDSIFEIARRMARSGGHEEQGFFLNSLRTRHLNSETTQIQRSSNEPLPREPLSEDDLQLMLDCYESLASQETESTPAGVSTGNVAYDANGNMYVQINNQWVRVGQSFQRGGIYFSMVIEELRLAGRDEQAKKMVDEQLASAESAGELAAAMAFALQDEHYDDVSQLYEKWLPVAADEVAQASIDRQGRQTRAAGVDQLGMVAGVLTQWMGDLAPEEEHEQILKILDSALNLSIAQSKKQQALLATRRRNRTTSASATAVRTISFRFVYGKESNRRIQGQVILPSGYVDMQALNLMRQAYETFKKNEAPEAFRDYLDERLKNTGDVDRPYEEILQANYAWWEEEQDRALELLTDAASSFSGDPEFTLHLAAMHEALRNYDEALTLLESITPRDQKLVQLREIAVLQLAERVGDIERARKAAERLFGLRLDMQTQISLVERMRRLGMHDMAQAVISRAQRRSGNQASSLLSLMTLYQGQGNIDLATQLAHRILRQTQPPPIQTSRYRTSSSDSGIRNQALRVLQQTGELQKLVARLESQLDKSPRSPHLYLQLMEFYTALHEQEKVAALLKRAIENRPDAIEFRYQLAQHLESTGKTDEACDAYLEVLRKKPAWMMNDFYRFRNVFRRANRQDDLITAVGQINLKSMGNPYYVINLVSEAINEFSRDSENQDLGPVLDLAERCFDAFPSYRANMLQNIYQSEVWKNDRIFELGKKAIVPTSSLAKQSPWYGVDQISSYSSGGQVNVMVHRVIDGIRNTPHMQELEAAVQSGIQEMPEWKGGVAVLALIELETNRKEAARDRLSQLISDEQIMKTMPADSSWIIGQELDNFAATRPLALKLLEAAVENNQTRHQVEYSPVARLADVYSKTGRREEARDLILKTLKLPDVNLHDANYSAYQRTTSSLWAANKLLEMGMPVAALRLSHELVTDPDGYVQLASQWQNENYDQQAERLVQQSLGKIDESNAQEAVAQLLSIPDKPSSDELILNLMMKVPTVQSIRTEPIESGLVSVLESVNTSEAIAAEMQSRLETLRKEFPEDLSIQIVATLNQLETKPTANAGTEGLPPALQQLLALVADSPLEEIAEDRRPNSRQRREAERVIPLWLVARKCLQNPAQRSAGETLAAAALAGARRQVNDNSVVAILYDWGKIALEAGKKQQAEEKWRELLDIVTRRPGEKPSRSSSDTSWLPPSERYVPLPSGDFIKTLPVAEPPERAVESGADRRRGIPPLTISQFRIVIEIATVAAQNGMPDLSRQALQESVVGGPPVPDLDDSNSSQRQSIGTLPSQQNNLQQQSAYEVEVATSLEKVVTMWEGDAYPPEEVYELLIPIVFPEHRPTEILLYADSSRLTNAEAHNLGSLLTKWALRAAQADDLKQRIAKRSQLPMSQTAGRVLLTQLALETGNVEQAQEQLSALSEVIAQGSQPEIVHLACHAALAATKESELQELAFPILRKTVEQLARTSPVSSSSSAISIGKLAQQVNRQLAKQGEVDAIRQFYDGFLVARQETYSRYSGDYGMVIQWRDMAALADEAAKVGLPDLALDYMGRVTDFSHSNYTAPSTRIAMALVTQALAQLSPEQRYLAWKGWSLPNDTRRLVRLQTEWVAPIQIPQAFQNVAQRRSLRQTDLLSNLTELVDAAKAAGRLDELRQAAQQAFDEKLPNAEFLLPLVLIAADDLAASRPVIQQLIETIDSRNKRESGQPRPTVMGDYLVYRACMQNPPFAELYASHRDVLVNAFHSNYNLTADAHQILDFAAWEAAQLGSDLPPDSSSEFVHWQVAPSSINKTDGVKPWWVSQGGHLNVLAGAGYDLCFFKYPLAGDFEFSVDCYSNSWMEAEASYGGLILETIRESSSISVHSHSRHESLRRPKSIRHFDGFNRLTIRHKNGEFQQFLNNQLVYSEQTSGTSPWITLSTYRPAITSYRNLSFTGHPEIASEVKLFSGDRMDGWNTSFFDESQPRHRMMAEEATENSSLAYQQRREPTEHDWTVAEGVLHSSAQDDAQSNDQSWNYYTRPLLEGETFQYEFFYVPGQSVAQPTIGRTALLLKSEGVTAHWIVDPEWDSLITGIPAENETVEPDCRRGPEMLPLQVGDWNHVSLTRQADEITLTLNGTLIYERSLDENIVPRFGLFKYQTQDLKVRNATLTGPWPESVSDGIQSELIAMTSPFEPAARKVVDQILPEEIFATTAAEIVSSSRALEPRQAYAMLYEWVLPSEDHEEFRPYYQRLPIDLERELLKAADPLAGVACPAMELMKRADELGKLPELREQLSRMPAKSDRQQRAQRAIVLLAAIQAKDDPQALELLTTFYEELRKGLPENRDQYDQAAQIVAALFASTRPALQLTAREMVWNMREAQRKKATTGLFKLDVEALMGLVDSQIAASIDQATTPLTQWTEVPRLDAPTLAAGEFPAQWKVDRGVLRHLPGRMSNPLYFQSPLQGRFEVQFTRTLNYRRDIEVAYGMYAAEPMWDYSKTRVYSLMHGSSDVGEKLTILPNRPRQADFRVVVDGNTVTTFVEGHQLHQQMLSPAPDPWLVIQGAHPNLEGTVQNVRIQGDPTVPEQIDLINTFECAGFRADFYGDAITFDSEKDAAWKRVGEEIRGDALDKKSGKSRQSLLTYQRPMLEDGVISYQFYYVPGEFEVHPALGQIAFLIVPNGIQGHRLTNAAYERSDLAPDNRFEIPDAATEVPLKEKEWNAVELVLKGDELRLLVNGQNVAQQTLTTPVNLRHFSLFRFADQSACRVRNLMYEGDWPRTLPTIGEQELAVPRNGPFAGVTADWKRIVGVDLSQPMGTLSTQGVRIAHAPGTAETIAAGLRIDHNNPDNPSHQGRKEGPSLNYDKQLESNCQVTLDFSNLQLGPVTGWGSGLRLQMDFAGPEKLSVAIGVGHSAASRQEILALSTMQIGKDQRRYESETHPHVAESGRLRLLRLDGYVHCFMAEHGSEHFKLYRSIAVGSAPIEHIRLRVMSGDEDATVAAVLERFTLEAAADISEFSASTPKPPQ